MHAYLIDNKRQPTKELCELAKTCGMQEANYPTTSLEEINAWMQKNLLRQQERWEIKEDKFGQLTEKLYPLLVHFGFIESKKASLQYYEGAIVHGALLIRVKARLNTLIEEWQNGVRFTHLYFLTGERPLVADLEKIEAKTEAEMMKRLWEETTVPQDMRDCVEIHIVSAPMKKVGQTFLRPTTEDTVQQWLKLNPPAGYYLSVSNAPYIVRQDLIMNRLCPQKYHIETIGNKASEKEKMAIFLDEVARVIFILNR